MYYVFCSLDEYVFIHSCSLLGTPKYGVEMVLVKLVLGYCESMEYGDMCLGHDTSVRQHW